MARWMVIFSQINRMLWWWLVLLNIIPGMPWSCLHLDMEQDSLFLYRSSTVNGHDFLIRTSHSIVNSVTSVISMTCMMLSLCIIHCCIYQDFYAFLLGVFLICSFGLLKLWSACLFLSHEVSCDKCKDFHIVPLILQIVNKYGVIPYLIKSD